MAIEMEKAKALRAFFASVFTGKTGLQESQKSVGKLGAWQTYPLTLGRGLGTFISGKVMEQVILEPVSRYRGR